jgi:hypothetical protein
MLTSGVGNMPTTVIGIRVDEATKRAYDSLPGEAKYKIRVLNELVINLLARGMDVNIVKTETERKLVELCPELRRLIDKVRSETRFTKISSNSVVENSIQRMFYLIETRLCTATHLVPVPVAQAEKQAGEPSAGGVNEQ